MRAKLVIGFLIILSLSFAAIALAVDAPPKGKISVAEHLGFTGLSKKSAIFDHDSHVKAVENQCATCHVVGASKKVLVSQKTGQPLDISTVVQDGVKNTMHVEFCWECHNVKKVNVGRNCATCHTGAKL